ncbi:histone H1-like [Gambusia affinis]|uniref:histone H1-like n=1 Tax=Gambusia affinis TaxID=33528 RepID=UPI001CDB59EF|nr:histone H1-like [Gambusia affinis]
MAEVAPSAVVIPADVPHKPPPAPRPKKGASIYKLIVAIVAESKDRKGMSLTALKKALAVKGVNVSKGNKRINNAVTKLVTSGTLSRTKGTGACGSFKLAKPKRDPKASNQKKAVKKKASAKAKRSTGKKASAPKRPAKRAAAKKSPKKSPAKKVARKVKKSPKKTVVRRPKTVKRPKSAKKPKPARRPAAKRPVAKKRPIKRRPAKKARRY